MAARVQKTRSKTDFRRDETFASQTLSTRRTPSGRNVAPDVFDSEPEDYAEEDQADLGTKVKDQVTPGMYEEDYGIAGQGVRGNPGVPEDAPPADDALPRRSRSNQGPDAQDFPTGAWSRQKTTATLPHKGGTKTKVEGGSRGTQRVGPRAVRDASRTSEPRRGSQRRRGST